jgi:hypothetical protein
MRIFQLNSSPFWQSFCFLLSQMTGSNELSGPIPPEIGQLTYLEELNLRTWTQMTDYNALSGPMPFWQSFCFLLSQMTGSNELSGPIPPEIGQLTYLQYLDFSTWTWRQLFNWIHRVSDNYSPFSFRKWQTATNWQVPFPPNLVKLPFI